MAPVDVKVFGLPRSGTNYLRWLLDANFTGVRTNKAVCWEHSLPYDRKRMGAHVRRRARPADREVVELGPNAKTALEATEGMVRVVVVKDIGHWYESIERTRRMQYGTAAMINANFDAPSLEALYHRWHSAWAPHARFIRYESFISDFHPTLGYLGSLIGSPPTSFTQPSRVAESPHWLPHDRERYL